MLNIIFIFLKGYKNVNVCVHVYAVQGTVGVLFYGHIGWKDASESDKLWTLKLYD